MADEKIYRIRQGHVQEDSAAVSVGDRFFLVDAEGNIGKKPQFLYKKGEGHEVWGEGFRIVGLDRFVDFQGIKKILISSYADVNGKFRLDCRAEKFPVFGKNTLRGLNEVGRLLPYDIFLNEHGCTLDNFEGDLR